MDTFTNKFDEKIRPLMDKIDQVRSILSGGIEGVTFPTVVVVGDQSSGKSTLLEALSLVELPKGSGIVTRCPLVLRLRKSTKRSVYRLNGENEKTLLNEDELNIMSYIEEETKKLAGDQKNVVKDLIELQVEDPNIRDLTVVDLPGIARNPIGDQPKDIHGQTTSLIRHFIRQEGSVILCVFPANVDVATVESFTLAREVDPTGIRTIGVITKSDLAPNDDQLCQQLLMEKKDVLQLKLGFIAVRNRAVDEKMTLSDARKREKKFFRDHIASSVVGLHCLGIDALINRLADLYADRVQKTFPQMRKEIQNKLDSVREQLINFPEDLDTPTARLAKYHELADFYVENVLKVRFSPTGYEDVSLVNLLHGKFQLFKGILDKQKRDLYKTTYVEKISRAMSACAGEQLPNFLPHPLLKRFIDEKVEELWRTSKSLANDCFSATVGQLFKNDNDPSQQDDIMLLKILPAFSDITKSYLAQQRQSVLDQLQELTNLEKNQPYTMNDEYLDLINKYRDNITNGEVTSSDDQSVKDMVESVRSYWEVIRKRFLEYSTLIIRDRFVFSVCKGIRDRLRRVPTEQCDFVDSYLAEDAHTRAQRKKLQQTVDRLEKVLCILGGQKLVGTTSTFLGTGFELETIANEQELEKETEKESEEETEEECEQDLKRQQEWIWQQELERQQDLKRQQELKRQPELQQQKQYLQKLASTEQWKMLLES